MMTTLFDQMKAQVKKEQPKLIFPEGHDGRICEAVQRLAEEEIIFPILIAKRDECPAYIQELEKKDRLSIKHPEEDPNLDRLADKLADRRKGKLTKEEAAKWLQDENYYGTMLVYTNQAAGLVSGATHSTADTVRPALQIIKTKPGVKRTSGSFIMLKGEEQLLFADCAINIAPDSEVLADIAIESANTAKAFGMDPKIAMLSFSTKGSAKAPETDKVIEATQLVKEKRPDLFIDGEFQFDAAYVPEVAQTKAPDSPLKGKANVFVFPSLEAGNIGYKIAQRLGEYEAIGPILQGLNQPVNDLSRGCNTEDVYKLAIITAMQSVMDSSKKN